MVFTIPECAEKTIRELLSADQSKRKELLNRLKEQIKEEKNQNRNIETYLTEADNNIQNESFINTITNIKKEIIIIDFDEVENLTKIAKKAAEKIENQDIILLFGATGSGKSTTIHYLAGQKLEEIGKHHIVPEKPFTISDLEKITISNSALSETRNICTISVCLDHIIQGESGIITYCDTPGYGDTSGAEVDISNFIGINYAISKSKTVKILALLSGTGIGGKGEGLKSLLEILSKMILTDFEDRLQSITYGFTKFTENNLNYINKTAKNLKKQIEANNIEISDENFIKILNNFIEKTENNNTCLFINPLDKNPSNLTKILLKCNATKFPDEAFSISLSSKSENMISKHINNISYHLQNAMLNNRFDLVVYYLHSLQRMKNLLDKNKEISDTFERNTNTIMKEINEKLEKMKDKFNILFEKHLIEIKEEQIIKLSKEYNQINELKDNFKFEFGKIKTEEIIINVSKNLNKIQKNFENKLKINENFHVLYENNSILIFLNNYKLINKYFMQINLENFNCLLKLIKDKIISLQNHIKNHFLHRELALFSEKLLIFSKCDQLIEIYFLNEKKTWNLFENLSFQNNDNNHHNHPLIPFSNVKYQDHSKLLENQANLKAEIEDLIDDFDHLTNDNEIRQKVKSLNKLRKNKVDEIIGPGTYQKTIHKIKPKIIKKLNEIQQKFDEIQISQFKFQEKNREEIDFIISCVEKYSIFIPLESKIKEIETIRNEIKNKFSNLCIEELDGIFQFHNTKEIKLNSYKFDLKILKKIKKFSNQLNEYFNLNNIFDKKIKELLNENFKLIKKTNKENIKKLENEISSISSVIDKKLHEKSYFLYIYAFYFRGDEEINILRDRIYNLEEEKKKINKEFNEKEKIFICIDDFIFSIDLQNLLKKENILSLHDVDKLIYKLNENIEDSDSLEFDFNEYKCNTQRISKSILFIQSCNHLKSKTQKKLFLSNSFYNHLQKTEIQLKEFLIEFFTTSWKIIESKFHKIINNTKLCTRFDAECLANKLREQNEIINNSIILDFFNNFSEFDIHEYWIRFESNYCFTQQQLKSDMVYTNNFDDLIRICDLLELTDGVLQYNSADRFSEINTRLKEKKRKKLLDTEKKLTEAIENNQFSTVENYLLSYQFPPSELQLISRKLNEKIKILIESLIIHITSLEAKISSIILNVDENIFIDINIAITSIYNAYQCPTINNMLESNLSIDVFKKNVIKILQRLFHAIFRDVNKYLDNSSFTEAKTALQNTRIVLLGFDKVLDEKKKAQIHQICKTLIRCIEK